MFLCCDGHDQIVYEHTDNDTRCPVCILISDKDLDIEVLTQQLADAESEISTLRGEMNGMEREASSKDREDYEARR